MIYQGSNKTAQYSQAQICEAFLYLLAHKPYEAISVADICRYAGVSRQTFYSLFASKENILLFYLTKKKCYRTQTLDQNSGYTFASACAQYIIEERQTLTILAQNHLLYLLQNLQTEAFYQCETFLPTLPNDERRYASSFIAGGLCGIIETYIRYGCKESFETLTNLIYNLYAGQYLKILG